MRTVEKLGLFPLEQKRLRGDLIEVFKIMKGFDRRDREKLFPLVGVSVTRGHSLKISTKRSRGEVRRNVFTQRVIGIWNDLPERAVKSDSITAFKRELDSIWGRRVCRVMGRKLVIGVSESDALSKSWDRLDGPNDLLLCLKTYVLMVYDVSSLLKIQSYLFYRLNGSLPENVEIQNNTLFFKGTVTYDLAGTYVCEATNAIGTRSGLVEVNVTGFADLKAANFAMSNSIVGGVALVILIAVVAFIVLRKRQQTFKGDYSTKKHVFGNGYSKAGIMTSAPQHVPYQEESDEDKKPSPINVSYENERKVMREGADFDVDSKRPYFTVDEGDTQDDFDDRTLSFQYQPELTEDMVSQNDGSIISKKEWYV
uniref:Ig-like domain-containing protein n=1 Tax=Callorhinchus milii TaxID=7868 RepID=A0A4W3GVX2_CALMI